MRPVQIGAGPAGAFGPYAAIERTTWARTNARPAARSWRDHLGSTVSR